MPAPYDHAARAFDTVLDLAAEAACKLEWGRVPGNPCRRFIEFGERTVQSGSYEGAAEQLLWELAMASEVAA